jgi:hypothetical protein
VGGQGRERQVRVRDKGGRLNYLSLSRATFRRARPLWLRIQTCGHGKRVGHLLLTFVVHIISPPYSCIDFKRLCITRV